MLFLVKNKPFFSTILFVCFTITLVTYLITQTFKGEYGLHNYSSKITELQNLTVKYENNNNKIGFYQKKINALDISNLDLDILEEELKRRMNFAHKNERVILY